MVRRRRRDDEGTALILVLAIVLILSVVLGAVATLTSTNLVATVKLRDVRAETYSLDAAVTGAVQQIRDDLTQGRAPGYTNGTNMCANYNAPTTDGQVVTVTCQGQQGINGQFDSGGTVPTSNPLNRPPTALWATSPVTSGEPGITLDANGIFRIHGSVISRSSIDVSNATLRVEGDITANGACNGGIESLGPPYPPVGPGTPQTPDCNSSALLPIPEFDPAISAVPANRNVPNCTGGYLITFEPGRYTDAARLSNLASGSCQGKILWFKPGKYLFDFNNNGGLWSIGDETSNIIGGTPFGWNPSAPTRPVIPQADAARPAIHSCLTAYDALPAGVDPAAMGVQFIFTGNSRMELTPAGANVELCAQPSDSTQQIAIYGMPNIPSNAAAGVMRATGVSAGYSFPADVETLGLTIDGAVSAPVIPSTSPGSSVTATFTGFDQLSSAVLPDSASITSVRVRIAHLESSPANLTDTITLGITAADGTVIPPQPVATCVSSLAACTTSATVDVTRYLGDVGKLRSATGSGPSVSYTVLARPNRSLTESFDGLQLEVSWVPQSLTATSVSAPGWSAPNSALLIDGAPSSIPLANNQTVTTTLGGFDQLGADVLPATAVITNVTARVVHREGPNVSTVRLSGTAADGTAFTTPNGVLSPCPATLTECASFVDLTSQLGSQTKLRRFSETPPGSGTFIATGPTLTYAVRNGNGAGLAELDGIRLDVTYQASALGSSSGCRNVVPYAANDASTCALLRAHGNKAFFSVHGTIYAPGDAVDLKIMNGGTTIFGRGAIVRTLRLFFNPSVTYSGANLTIEIPDDSTFLRHDRIVDFWACLGRPAVCDDTNAELHAVVNYVDATSAGGAIAVKSWAHRR